MTTANSRVSGYLEDPIEMRNFEGPYNGPNDGNKLSVPLDLPSVLSASIDLSRSRHIPHDVLNLNAANSSTAPMNKGCTQKAVVKKKDDPNSKKTKDSCAEDKEKSDSGEGKITFYLRSNSLRLIHTQTTSKNVEGKYGSYFFRICG